MTDRNQTHPQLRTMLRVDVEKARRERLARSPFAIETRHRIRRSFARGVMVGALVVWGAILIAESARAHHAPDTGCHTETATPCPEGR